MDLMLIVVLLLLVVFMFWNSRKRMKKMKEEQEQKARQTVPGVEVMLQSGIFGTIVAYDADDLDSPAEIEIAPGVVIKVHTQAIARIVTPAEVEETSDEELAALPADIVVPDSPAGLTPETPTTNTAAEPNVSFDAEPVNETAAEPAVSFGDEPAATDDAFAGTQYDSTDAPRYETPDETKPRLDGDKQD